MTEFCILTQVYQYFKGKSKKVQSVFVCVLFLDSVIFVTRPQDTYFPETGAFLGELTSELDEFGEGAIITEFVGAGPKNYSYKVKTSDGKKFYRVKIRGFSLNFANSQHLTFKNMKKKVHSYLRGVRDESELIVQPRIERTASREVVTKLVPKKYRVVYSKRWVLQSGETLPFGTCEN